MDEIKHEEIKQRFMDQAVQDAVEIIDNQLGEMWKEHFLIEGFDPVVRNHATDRAHLEFLAIVHEAFHSGDDSP